MNFLGSHRKGECLLERLFSTLRKHVGRQSSSSARFALLVGWLSKRHVGRWVLCWSGKVYAGEAPTACPQQAGIASFFVLDRVFQRKERIRQD